MLTVGVVHAGPEVRKDGSLSKSADIYAFGVIMWELYAGRPCYKRAQIPAPSPAPAAQSAEQQPAAAAAAAVAGGVQAQGSSSAFVADPTFPSFPPSCPTLFIVIAQSCLQVNCK